MLLAFEVGAIYIKKEREKQKVKKKEITKEQERTADLLRHDRLDSKDRRTKGSIGDMKRAAGP